MELAEARPSLFGIRANKPFHVDVSMAPSETLLWYRTTLVKRNGAWDVEEANQLVSALESLTAPLVAPSTVEEVLTLGHATECTPEQLGYAFPDVRAQPAREGESHADASQQPVQPQVPQADDEPMDPEPLVAGQNEILIDGTRIASNSPISVLKTACGALGISGHGSRRQMFSRLVRHLQQQELLASHVVQHKLAAENARQPKAPGHES